MKGDIGCNLSILGVDRDLWKFYLMFLSPGWPKLFEKNPHKNSYIYKKIRTIRTFFFEKSVQSVHFREKSVKSVQKNLILRKKTSKLKKFIFSLLYHSFSFVFVCKQRLTLHCFKIYLKQKWLHCAVYRW